MVFTSEHLLRELAPQVLGAVIRRYGDFAAAEDAVQEALLAAAMQWPREGVPDSPRGWLIQVAARRMTDHIRSESARRRRETTVVTESPDYDLVPAADPDALSRVGWDTAGARRSLGWRRRHVDSAVHVLPHGAHQNIGYRSHPARRRRLDDG